MTLKRGYWTAKTARRNERLAQSSSQEHVQSATLTDPRGVPIIGHGGGHIAGTRPDQIGD